MTVEGSVAVLEDVEGDVVGASTTALEVGALRVVSEEGEEGDDKEEEEEEEVSVRSTISVFALA